MLAPRIRDGVLEIHDGVNPAPTVVSPRSTRIVQVLNLGMRVVVREDYYQFAGGSNVYCVDGRGRHIWDAELPMSDDKYANPVSYDSGVLTCASWNGFTCTIDPESGKIVSSEFTK